MARQFKKILCPVDFSRDSLTALDYAADFARQNEGQLILLHVVDNPLADQYGPRGRTFTPKLSMRWRSQNRCWRMQYKHMPPESRVNLS